MGYFNISHMAIDNISQKLKNVKRKILRKVSKYQCLRGMWIMWTMWRNGPMNSKLLLNQGIV